MKTIISFFLALVSAVSYAQEGAPLLTDIRQNKDIENQNWAICQDTNRVMIFANRKGLLSFDGQDWTPIRLQTTPYAVRMNPYNKRIYVGGDNNYGFIEKDSKGSYRYQSMSGDSSSLGLITRVIFNDSLVCFYGDASINCHNIIKNSAAKRYYPEKGTSFTGVFLKGDNMFVNVSGKGLHRIEADTLFPIVTGYLTEKTDILFSLPYDNNKVLLGLGDSKLSLFDGIKYYAYPVKDDDYILNNVLSEGILLGDSLYAFSTLGGGAVVVEKTTGKLLFTINNRKGLPDDEIFAIGSDAAGGLWLSHMYGLTRADLRLPVGNYAIYPGLTGNVSTALKYNNELYVATSEGVYYLSREKNYTEIEVLRKDAITPISVTHQEQVKESSKPLAAPKQQNTRKSIFTRIFGRKNPAETESATGSETPGIGKGQITVMSIPEVTFRKEKIKQLKSIDYLYKKIPGVNVRCRQLVPTQNGLLAATNRGLFIVRDHSSEVLAPDRYINSITWNAQTGKYGIAAADGYLIASFTNGRWTVSVPDKLFTDPLYGVVSTPENVLWMSGENVVFRADLTATGKPSYVKFPVHSSYIQRCLINVINDSIFLLTETGLNVFDKQNNSFIAYKPGYLNAENKEFRYPLSNFPMIVSGSENIFPGKIDDINAKDLCLLKLFDDVVSVYRQDGNVWVVDGSNRIYGIDSKKNASSKPETDLLVKKIRNEKGISFDLSEIVFERGDNVINFDIVVPSFLNRNITEYQYYIDRVMSGWSPWSTRSSYSRGIPRPGKYTLHVRARDIWGNIGQPVSLEFTMKAPFTKTTLFYMSVILATLLVILVIVRFREKQLQEKNRILEEKVKERTAEIEAQKEEITSSIEYASRIQMAMLPVSNLFAESFSDYFIIFKPRDIVSGDFYWIGEDKNNIYLTVADCTGHGVPGAFMSTLGISILNEILTHNKELQPNNFLNLLREQIKIMLHQTGKEGEAADGMDISLCSIRKDRKHIQFAGAYNSLYIHNEGEIKEIKADRMPIGIHYGDEASFTNNELKINKGDVLYLLSDGLTDQFGGPEGSKFKKAQFRNLLSQINQRPLSEQRKLIELEFIKWKGSNAQVDDITVIGVRI